METGTYQRVADADDVDDAVVVRIWKMDGELVGEADHPDYEIASQQLIVRKALGNPVPVPQALAEARSLVAAGTPFASIFVEIPEEAWWKSDWGVLLPIKPSPLMSVPFRL